MDMGWEETARLQAALGSAQVTRSGDHILILGAAPKPSYEVAYAEWWGETVEAARRTADRRVTWEEAEDLAQSAWLEVYGRWRQIAHSPALAQYTFIRNLVKWRTIDFLRRRSLPAHPIRLTDEIREYVEETMRDHTRYEPENVVMERETLSLAYTRLSERYDHATYSSPIERRKWIILSYLYEYGKPNYEKIQALLHEVGDDVSLSGVKMAVSRLRAHLRTTSRELVVA